MESNNGFGLFVLGLGVGAAAGILLAPKTGVQTRHYLQSCAEDAARGLKTHTNQVIGQASHTINRGTSRVREQLNSLSAAMEAGKRAYRDTVHS